MPNTPFPTRPDLTGIAIAYQNAAFIADEIYPYVPVDDFAFQWDQFAIDTNFNLWDDTVGPTSKPNEIYWESTRQSGRVLDRALDSPVPYADTVGESAKNYDAERTATMLVMQAIGLNREKRAAALTFTLENYLSTQRLTLSGTSQWSHVDSNPITAIETAIETPIMRPNIMVLGKDSWSGLRRHPKIVEAVTGTGAQYGLATTEQVATLFELEKVLVGRSRGDLAVWGQTPNLSPLWGKHAALLYRDPLSRNTIDAPPTWGMTARFGDRFGGTIPVPDMGARGGVRVRAGESVQELIVAQNCGYFFQNAVA